MEGSDSRRAVAMPTPKRTGSIDIAIFPKNVLVD
jgi:hypothetical protein